MSASTEKKLRQVGRADGTDKRTIAERKEAEKKAKDKVKWTVVAIAVVVFIAAVIYLNSGLFYRNTTALKLSNPAYSELNIGADSVKFSIAEVNYAYNSQLVTLLNNMGEYSSLYGLDTSKSLKSQECSIFRPDDLPEEESYTWNDYLMEAARHHLIEVTALCAYADVNGIALDDADVAEIEETMDQMEEYADQYGYGTANKFFAANYGTGCNLKLARSVMEDELLAEKVLNTISDSFTFTQAELDAKYESVKDTYDTFDYSYYLVNAEEVESTDSEGNTTSDVTDETMAAAKEKADAIKGGLDVGKSFDFSLTAVIPEITVDAYTDADGTEHPAETKVPEVVEKTDVTGSSLEYAITDWLLNASRKQGDSAVIEYEGVGYYVVVFDSRDNNKHTTSESGDMLYCDYIADALLRNDGLTDWQENTFEGLEAVYSLTDCFAIKYVGR